jgi:hypothetical protein
MKKQCTKCNEVKAIEEFRVRKDRKNGRTSRCIECLKAISKAYNRKNENKEKAKINHRENYLKNREERIEDAKVYRKENKEAIKKQRKSYREENKEKINSKRKTYNEENKEAIKKQRKSYREENKDIINERARIYREENKEEVLNCSRKYREENKEKYNKNRRDFWASNSNKAIERRAERCLNDKNRRDTDVVYSMKRRVGSMIGSAFRNGNYSKKTKTFEILGIDCEGLCIHIESLFLDEMTWENRKDWHIDHIVPISFAQTEEEVIKLNHYSNLRPFWATMNKARNNNIDMFIDHCEYSMRIVKEYKQAS